MISLLWFYFHRVKGKALGAAFALALPLGMIGDMSLALLLAKLLG